MVMEVVHEDLGEGSNSQCVNHQYKNSTPGGICAFCLQEKLGKLVSSSFPAPVFPTPSSSPSNRSAFSGNPTTTADGAVQVHHVASSSTNDTRRSRLPLFATHRRKNKNHADSSSIVFNRSKSTRTSNRGTHFMGTTNYAEDYSPYKRGFWSYLYLSKHSTHKNITPSSAASVTIRSKDKKMEDFVPVDETVSPEESTFDRKVSRSRSVGCGSRSFSGEFFERISTGFGDCTLRRVESQREGKTKTPSVLENGGKDIMKWRVKCGGIFSGFMVNSSSSSSSSSSSYWVSSSTEDNNNNSNSNNNNNLNGKLVSAVHARSKSWGWAFASPMRAFGKPFSAGKRAAVSSKNATPNLDAMPSLLGVSS